MACKKGFTIIEILIVLIIVGILAAILVPSLIGSTEQSRAQSARNNLYAIAAAEQQYSEDYNGSYCLTVPACGDSNIHINQNLLLAISANDPYTYNCTAASPYKCTATDNADSSACSLTLTYTTANGAVITTSGQNCPS